MVVGSNNRTCAIGVKTQLSSYIVHMAGMRSVYLRVVSGKRSEANWRRGKKDDKLVSAHMHLSGTADLKFSERQSHGDEQHRVE